MTGNNKRIYAYALTLAGAAISIASIAGVGLAHSKTTTDHVHPACEVAAENRDGVLALEAIYHADAATQGSYQFSVKSVGGAGSTNINQGGGFSANADESVVLGKMNLSGSSVYDVALTITADGATHECGGRMGAGQSFV